MSNAAMGFSKGSGLFDDCCSWLGGASLVGFLDNAGQYLNWN